MSLSICTDLSAARWLAARELSWERLVCFGPAGFPADARVRFIPDPAHPVQRETEADLGASLGEVEQWRALLQLLAGETPDPSDCYFALCDGWGFPDAANRWPTFEVPPSARFPAGAFFLFHGVLADAEISGSPAAAGIWGSRSSPAAAPLRLCGRPTTRGVSQRTWIRTGPGIGATVHLSLRDAVWRPVCVSYRSGAPRRGRRVDGRDGFSTSGPGYRADCANRSGR